MLRQSLMLSAALALSACVLPPKPAVQAHRLDGGELGLRGVEVAPAPEGWWESFKDPQLSELIRLGLKSNPTLAEARARVAAALAEGEVAHSHLEPNVSLDASALYQRAPQKYAIPPPLAGHTFGLSQVGANLGWDLDFWGKQAEAVARAQALTQSAQYDADNARLLLAGAITQAYIDWHASNAFSDIARRSEEQRQNIVNITERRVAAGLDTQLELREAQGQLPQARVARAQAQAAAQLSVHRLAALTGQGSEAYAALTPPTLDIDAALPVPVDLPMNLLARRPDVLAARMNIVAADAQRLADRAAFYPDVSLKALAGFGAFGWSNLVQASARGYGTGPVISLPLFDGGRLRAEYRGSEAQLESAIAAYNDTVLHALQQTADQLTRIDALGRERHDQEETLTASEAAYRLAEERYRAGLASYLSVLNAETQVLAARQTMVAMLADQAEARVTLLLALGGSFDPDHTNRIAQAGAATH
jgi:NodT family efflux transporter outer membrane factor (OMF) lipoprotein